MTKYELSGFFEDHDNAKEASLREIAIQLNYLANEQAEANRLKRYELEAEHGSNELDDNGIHHWIPDKELEDQA